MAEPVRLSGPVQPPASGGAPAQLVILLHGLGADGNDLIGLAPHWARLLPGAEFVAPHAPFACDMAPMGRQWFSLSSMAPEDLRRGVRSAAPILDAFIDAELARTGLGPDRLALVGFSQGTMLSLQVALRRARPPGAVLGYSGALVDTETLADDAAARPPILLIHGDADELIPVGALHQAVAALGAAGIPAQWHVCPGLGHGIDEAGLAIGGRFLKECLG